MNKTFRLMTGVAALAVFAACSSDEPANSGSDNGTHEPGQKAYLSIRINAAGDMGRSTDFDKPSYEDGDEHKVESAKFFFFYEDGTYAHRCEWGELTSSGNKPDNIEWIANQNVLVIEDYTSNKYPKYMLTVLNMPGFEAADNLSETTVQLSKYADNFGDNNNFVMSTTAYYGTDTNHDNDYYNVTTLTEDNFKLTASEAIGSSPVEVYVERLAAKVEVHVDITKDIITLADGTKLYGFNQTVGGSDNDENTNPGDANTKLYLKVLGWGLNATAKASHVGKQLKDEWENENANPFAAWNASDRFRSFWAYSWPYMNGCNAAAVDTYVDYSTAAKLNGELGKARYCYENTNNPANYMTESLAGQKLVDNRVVTHVALKTEIVNADGTAAHGVSFRGAYYLEDSFKALALRTLKNNTTNGGLNYWYQTSATETDKTYRQVDVKDLELTRKANTIGGAELKLANKDQLYEQYTKEDGTKDYRPIESNNLQSRLDAFAGANLEYYGANVYFIPVEHNALAKTAKDAEGYYGVVRNHWYKMTISKFSHIGHAVFDPDDDEIVIKPDGPEDPLYYVGAKVNILSWRVVNQNVEL